MRSKLWIASQVFFLLMVAILAAGGALAQQVATSGNEQKDDAVGFKEFLGRVQEYVKLHKTIEATLPPLKDKEELPEMISAHQQALARKIRQARLHSELDEIFTKSSREAFRHAIRRTFQGQKAPHALATMKQGTPLRKISLKVNEVYPDGVPQTTVPPTLLQNLPKLPDELQYRVMGRDLILLDVRANLVVGLLRDVLPWIFETED
jgi:hypothetical protein